MTEILLPEIPKSLVRISVTAFFTETLPPPSQITAIPFIVSSEVDENDESFSINPRRGEYLLFDKECGNTVNCTIFRTPSKMGKGILVSPTVDGNLLLGPTAENIEDKDDHSTTASGLGSVMKNAAEVLRVVPGGKTITSFCGLRATGSTGDFIITNPPFSKATEFITHALELGKPCAFLLKSQFWHAKSRLDLFRANPPSYVLPLTWRPDFLYGAKSGSPTMECLWTVWAEGSETIYYPLEKPKGR